MTDIGLETVGAPVTNGATDHVNGESKSTVIARDDVLNGRLQIKGGAQILGTFSGQIDCDGDLMIGPEAHVDADIRGARVTISGYMRGNVTAISRLKITSSGRLEGDARVGALVVLEGGVHHGVIRVHPEGIPEARDTAIIDSSPRNVVALKSLPNPVGRVRKLWGEFF